VSFRSSSSGCGQAEILHPFGVQDDSQDDLSLRARHSKEHAFEGDFESRRFNLSEPRQGIAGNGIVYLKWISVFITDKTAIRVNKPPKKKEKKEAGIHQPHSVIR